MSKILLVEDDDVIRELVTDLLTPAYQVIGVANIKGTKEQIRANEGIDLVVLDLGLPDGSGMEILTYMYQNRPNVPVLIVSGKSDPSVKVAGFDLGAADYIVKPFDPGEFCARIRAKLRDRKSAEAGLKTYIKGGFYVDEGRLKVFSLVEDKKVDLNLSPVEFKLLIHFIKNQNQVFSRDQLITSCSGADYAVSDRSIDVHIYSLRKKIGQDKGCIKTIYGVGYIFEESTGRRARSGNSVA